VKGFLNNPLTQLSLGLLQAGAQGQAPGAGLANGFQMLQRHQDNKMKNKLLEARLADIEDRKQEREAKRQRQAKLSQFIGQQQQTENFEADTFPGEAPLQGNSTITQEGSGILSDGAIDQSERANLGLLMMQDNPSAGIALMKQQPLGAQYKYLDEQGNPKYGTAAQANGQAPYSTPQRSGNKFSFLNTGNGVFTGNRSTGEVSPTMYDNRHIESNAQGVQSRHGENMDFKERQFEFSRNKHEIKNTDDIAVRYEKETKPVKGALRNIDIAIQAAESQNPLSDVLLQQALSQVVDTNVRAQAELEKFGNFGALDTKIKTAFNKAFSGQYSDEARADIIATLTQFRDGIYTPVLNERESYYKGIAKDRKLNIDHIIPPKVQSFTGGTLE